MHRALAEAQVERRDLRAQHGDRDRRRSHAKARCSAFAPADDRAESHALPTTNGMMPDPSAERREVFQQGAGMPPGTTAPRARRE